jgi:hypothetical protein
VQEYELGETYSLDGHTSLFQEVGSLTHERRTTCCLDQPNDTGNFGSSQVDTLETVGEGDTADQFLLNLVRVDHEGYGLLRVVDTVRGFSAGHSHHDVFGFFEFTLSYQVPRRFRGEEDTDDDGDWPDPE